jgi:hypothetical protein
MAVDLSPIGGSGWQFFDNNGAAALDARIKAF